MNTDQDCTYPYTGFQINTCCGRCHGPIELYQTSICKRCELEDRLSALEESSLLVPPWLSIAFSLLGTAEIPGPPSNEKINAFLHTVGLPADDSIPWCSAFVAYCMTQANKMQAINNAGMVSAAARSWLNFGVECGEILGSIVVLWRGEPESWMAHVGLLVGIAPMSRYILGGNQSNTVSIAEFSLERVLGYRWPK